MTMWLSLSLCQKKIRDGWVVVVIVVVGDIVT